MNSVMRKARSLRWKAAETTLAPDQKQFFSPPPISCRLLFAFIELIISVFFWLHRFDNRFAAPISSRLLLLSSCGAMTKDNKIGHNVKSGGRSLMSDKSSIKAFFKQKQNGN